MPVTSADSQTMIAINVTANVWRPNQPTFRADLVEGKSSIGFGLDWFMFNCSGKAVPV